VSKSERKELEAVEKLTEKERWDEAIAKLEVLRASADPEVHDLALNYIADAYESTGRHADAESALRQSIDERGADNEGLASQLAVLAPVVRRQGRNEEAEFLYQRALEAMKPDEPELKSIAMRNLAYLYWSTGREDAARRLYADMPEGDDGFLGFLSGLMKPYIEPEIPI
jgi:tetratricopeptide (TPR) repeat protein